MIIFIDARHVRCEKSRGYDGRPSEWVDLPWDYPRSDLCWLVDQGGVRLPEAAGKYLISNRSIEHYAAVSHKAWCTLLIFGSVRFREIQAITNHAFSEKMQPSAYSELGTTLSPTAAKTMVQGIKSLELKMLEFTWPEFLEHTHLCRASRSV